MIIFAGCNFRILYDYNYDQQVWISEGETLYKNSTEWVRLDSIAIEPIDSNNYACFTAFYDSSEYIFTLGKSSSYTFYNNYYTLEYLILYCLDIDGQRVKYSVHKDIYAAQVDKPNIYLYPEKKTKMTVSLDLPEGGKVTESIPAYPKKWKNIRVKPDGTINRKYDFLFYEADLPGDWQFDKGWVVAQKDLKFFFQNNLRDYGFNKKEIKDFTDWWVARLKDHPYYEIYPQHTAKIESIVPLRINKEFDSLLRLFYFVDGTDDKRVLPEPKIPEFERKGFVVTEWGVSLR
jgi:hypothetical protein